MSEETPKKNPLYGPSPLRKLYRTWLLITLYRKRSLALLRPS